MADANSTLYKVPFWLVNHLGKRVQLLREFVDDSDVFEAGSLGVLDGITTDDSYAGGVCAVVVFDEDCTRALTHVPFDLLCIPGRGEGSAARLRELCSGLHGRVGDIVQLWTMGIDPKDRVPRTTYYRYLNQLRVYGIDIAKPFSEALAIANASSRAQPQEA
ncbi:MAG: hypothetical protein CL858_34005 [Cupriavidus sp.]|nr:hypothetical protein [Cupriavidus sp.]